VSGCRGLLGRQDSFRNDLTGMVNWGGGGCGESVMRPRGALCGCCENTLLWDVETVL